MTVYKHTALGVPEMMIIFDDNLQIIQVMCISVDLFLQVCKNTEAKKFHCLNKWNFQNDILFNQ